MGNRQGEPDTVGWGQMGRSYTGEGAGAREEQALRKASTGERGSSGGGGIGSRGQKMRTEVHFFHTQVDNSTL